MNTQSTAIWGTLAPDMVISTRRQQSLGLTNAVRHFNDRSVPGIGGMWFPIPLLWSILAVAIAEKLNRNALPIGNAIEALAMSRINGASPDPRIRGRRKLSAIQDISFDNLSRRGVYITQPIRMSLVQPLVELGYVTGNRYGSFRLATGGKEILNLPLVTQLFSELLEWVNGSEPRGFNNIWEQISPLGKVDPIIRKHILASLLDGNDDATQRRLNLEKLSSGPSAEQLKSTEPLGDIKADHWCDLRAGAALVDIRKTAIDVLDALEEQLIQMRDSNEPVCFKPADASEHVRSELQKLKTISKSLQKRVLDGKESASSCFAKECSDMDSLELLQNLAKRDGSVIDLRDGMIVAGTALGDSRTILSDQDSESTFKDKAFAPQLFRLFNFHCLVTELKGAVNPACKLKEQEAVL